MWGDSTQSNNEESFDGYNMRSLPSPNKELISSTLFSADTFFIAFKQGPTVSME
jgi:hypothetical protein